MATVASTLLPVVGLPVSPVITNIVMTTAGTEYSHTFTQDVQSFTIKTRNGSNLKFAFVAGQSGTNYISLPGRASYGENSITVNSVTMYFQSDQNGDILEVLEWF